MSKSMGLCLPGASVLVLSFFFFNPFYCRKDPDAGKD